jgi:predicted metalloenzyme YecM
VYELAGKYYQVLGHAWDHTQEDFCVVYRPLYHCEAKPDRFEAHILATSSFKRWETKFKKVAPHEIPDDVVAWLLPGPFAQDPDWSYPCLTRPFAPSQSGRGSRTHCPLPLGAVIGDFRLFVEAVHANLCAGGLDPISRKLQIDHICYRTETKAEYVHVQQKLVPAFGECIQESMIDGRPITIIRLRVPIVHLGYSIACVELPCPKSSSPYRSGLEHAEIVVGSEQDGCASTERLNEFLAELRSLGFVVDTKGLSKKLNADVSISFDLLGRHPVDRTITVKFHQRPIDEVVAYEQATGHVEPVPAGYFA